MVISFDLRLLVTPPKMEHNSNLFGDASFLAVPAIHFFGFPGYYTASPPRLQAHLFEDPARKARVKSKGNAAGHKGRWRSLRALEMLRIWSQMIENHRSSFWNHRDLLCCIDLADLCRTLWPLAPLVYKGFVTKPTKGETLGKLSKGHCFFMIIFLSGVLGICLKRRIMEKHCSKASLWALLEPRRRCHRSRSLHGFVIAWPREMRNTSMWPSAVKRIL